AAGGFDDGVPGDPTAVKFPRGLMTAKDLRDPERRYAFSFSGLKTAALRAVEVERTKPEFERVRLADIAASFEEAVVDVLVRKTLLACEDTGINRVLLGGGVAANRRLRDRLSQRCEDQGISLLIPPLSLCTDN
ncbi:Kae1-like domain-containing protein, partial [Brevibacterium paucivorans]